MSQGVFNLLCPFQIDWLRETAPLAIAEKSRRIGWTWTHALGVVLGRVEGDKGNYYHSSADQTAAVEFIDYCDQWAQMIKAVATVTDGEEIIDDEKITTKVMTFANGTKIVAGSSNPKFFRSKGGEVGLDEYAFHRDGRELFKAAHATAMFWGYPLRAWSTHNGPTSYFNTLLQAIRKGDMKGRVHRVTIEDAVAGGIVERIIMRKKKLDHVPAADEGARKAWLEDLRATCPDQDTWNEEYLCIPSTDQGSLLSYELIAGCEVANIRLADDVAAITGNEPIYAGFDVGRKHDRSCLWALGKLGGGDVYWTRALKVLEKMPFAAQEDLLNRFLQNPRVKRLCIDASGLGMDLAERLVNRWGPRVEAVSFTGPVKAELALPLLRLFQDKRVRVPAEVDVREDLHKIRKTITAAGNVRFEAPRDDEGHADRFWSLALAFHAADDIKRPLPPPIEKPLCL